MDHLPDELICCILRATDSVQAMIALADTCHAIRSVWNNNLSFVGHAVLRESVPSYNVARQFVVAEQHNKSEGDEILTNAILKRAQMAHLALKLFETNLVAPWGRTPFFSIHRTSAPYMSRTERSRFLQAYHILRLLVWYHQNESWKTHQWQILRDMSIHTIFHVRDVAAFVSNVYNMDYRTRWRRQDSHVQLETERAWARVDAQEKAWWEDADATIGAILFGNEEMRSKMDKTVIGYPAGNPEGMFALFDECQNDIREI